VGGLIDKLLDQHSQQHFELQKRVLHILITLSMAETANCFTFEDGNSVYVGNIPFFFILLIFYPMIV
jgi:hypothetical protein